MYNKNYLIDYKQKPIGLWVVNDRVTVQKWVTFYPQVACLIGTNRILVIDS